MKKIIYKNGVYRCPICGSKKVAEIYECVVFKYCNLNTQRFVNPSTGNLYITNRDKVFDYDNAESVSGDVYECLNCHFSDIEK